MRFILIFLLHVNIFAISYNFKEIKYVSAVDTEFVKKGNIVIDKDKTVITYSEPSFKQIIQSDNNISIKGSSGDIYYLKDKALFYTNIFIGVMNKLGEIEQIKDSDEFNVQKESDIYYVTFKGDVADQIDKAEVSIKKQKVKSFKLFMINEDTLEIIKK